MSVVDAQDTIFDRFYVVVSLITRVWAATYFAVEPAFTVTV